MNRRLLATVLAGIVAAPVLAADLAIEVHGIQSSDGQLYVAVHSPESAETFPAADGMFAGLSHRARAGTLRFVLRDLPAGRYAISAFHDENGNRELDTNPSGIPTEGYGFANDPNTELGPADFEAAAVEVGATNALAAVSMRYRLQGGS